MSAAAVDEPVDETVDKLEARQSGERKALGDRLDSKRRGATKKTRTLVRDECASLEAELRDRHAHEPGAVPARATATEPAAVDPAPADDAGADASAGAAAPAKRRNRQRERLARRAADATAVTAAAEAEAATMVDRRAVEAAGVRRAMAAHGLVEVDIPPDGHCLFAAVADQLAERGLAPDIPAPPPPPPHVAVRRRAADYILAHPDAFAPFVDEALAPYAARIRDSVEWGGQIELTALAAAYGVEICVVQDGHTERIAAPAGEADGAGERPVLWLAYYRHGYGLGEHYNSLRKAALQP